MSSQKKLKVRYSDDDLLEAGVDEAGRGSFWGPLVAAAVILPPEDCWDDDVHAVIHLIRDSKKLSPKKRAEAEIIIKNIALAVGVGVVSAGEIDKEGMTWANQMAFVRAIEQLQITPQRLLIDGVLTIQLAKNNLFDEPAADVDEIYTFTGGDDLYLPIAAASIIAKEYHDTYVRMYAETNPKIAEKYGLLTNKGYGTATHRSAIDTYGLLDEHRRRFLTKSLNFS